MNQPPPIPASACSDEWVQAVREAASMGGWPMRCNATIPMLEFKDCNHNEWRIKQLPGGGTLFVSLAERDAVARRLA